MKMTEGRAIALVFFVGLCAITAGCVVLTSVGAGGGAVALMTLVVGAVVIQFLDAVVQRYVKERRKR
jgi:hypothetical protein